MSEIKLNQVNDYSTAIAYANSSEIVYYEQFGSYQGDWLLVTKDLENYYIYKDYYGSCSGCDSYEATFSWSEEKTDEKVKEFAKDYKPFAIVPTLTMRNLVQNGTLKQIFPKNIRGEYDGDIDWMNIEADISLSVKMDAKLPIHAIDILTAKNQETRQRGLKEMGYEKFVDEAKPETLDVDNENSLLKIDDIVLAYVKDSSTPRKYLLRVPPHMRRVKEAIAWTFGKSESEYQPIKET